MQKQPIMSSDLDARARRCEREERGEWKRKYEESEAENKQLREKMARLMNRQKLLQTTFVKQQEVLDRYQRELAAHVRKKALSEAENSTPVNTVKRGTDASNEEVENHKIKRAKSDSVKQRRSLPLADRPTPDDAHSSPRRRRSLPEPTRRSDNHGLLVREGNARDVWTTRKLDMDCRAPIYAAKTSRPRPLTSLSSHRGNARHAEEKGEAFDSSDEFLNDYNAAGSHKANSIKTELKDNKRSPLQEHLTRDRPIRPPYQRRALPFRNHSSSITTKPPSREPPESIGPGKGNTFAYVEVVRNRAERAALPGHDCIECRKYYEALDGLVSEHEMKDKCSRHRARFEPYQTPDDFWRLSFPDSHSEEDP